MHATIKLSKEFIESYLEEIDSLIRCYINCGKKNRSAVSNLTSFISTDIYRCMSYVNNNQNIIDDSARVHLRKRLHQVDTKRIEVLRE